MGYSKDLRRDSMQPEQSWSEQRPPIDIPPSNEPMLRLERSVVHGQCTSGIESVMVNNQTVTYFRVTVLRRREKDEYKAFPVLQSKRIWFGCGDDGYVYSLYSLTKL
jgi:hypothetical protein